MTEKIEKKPGFDKNTTLADHMKEYESISDYKLIPNCPIYARIDGRAFHSFCRNLKKPFDPDFVNTMRETCRHIVEKTNALVGYVQSDELSFGWKDSSKVPFGNRLFKLESVLSGMATSAFILYGLKTTLRGRIEQTFPHFDCRVLNLPTMGELSNMFLWRELDCMKNSITMVASTMFSDKELLKKTSEDKIEMMKDKGMDYYKDIPVYLQRGTFFRRELYLKEMTEKELQVIPKDQIRLNSEGKMSVVRSHVIPFEISEPLCKVANRSEVLFESKEDILR